MNTQKIFIFAGEPSGDLHGGYLIQALKDISSHYQIDGVGGPFMRSQGLLPFFPMEDFAVMGFSDVIKTLPHLIKKFLQVKNHILKTNPSAVILIDYPGFNLRLAKSLRKKGFKGKIIHYICPSVWAHGKGRIQQMVRSLDLLLTIFPFEADYFSNTSLKVQYIGNPLQEYIQKHSYITNWKEILQIPKDASLIAVFPGSRQSEIERNFPKQLKTLEALNQENLQFCFGISCSSPHLQSIIEKHITASSLKLNQDIFLIPKNYRYELMKDSHSAIAKSGTVTLELALHHRPTVVVYELSWLNRFVAKYILKLKLPFYCLVNILAGKTVFPELIEKGFSSKNLLYQFKPLLTENALRNACIEECQKLQKMLGNNEVSHKAAYAIHELIK